MLKFINTMYYSNLLLFLFSVFCFRIIAQPNQDRVCLEDVLEYTQTNSFAINSLYKVVAKNLEEREPLKVKIEGGISDPDFSFAIISMLPALKRQMNNSPILELVSYEASEKDFEEFLVINAVEKLYPDQYFDYLIYRAKYEFVENWVRVARSMNFDVDKIYKFISNSENRMQVKKSFTSDLYDEYRIEICGKEVVLIKNFFKELFDMRIQSASTPYIRCISDAFYLTTTRFLNGGFFTESDSTLITELYRKDPNEMYFELLVCMNDSRMIKLFGSDNIGESNWVVNNALTRCLKGEFEGVSPLAISACEMDTNHFYQQKIKVGLDSKIVWGKIKDVDNN